MRTELADGIDDGVVEAVFFWASARRFLALEIGEVQWIGGAQSEVNEFIAGFEQVFDTGARIDAEVVAALGADLLVGVQFGLEDVWLGPGHEPEAFRANRLFRVVYDLVVLAFEPRSCVVCLPECLDYCSGGREMHERMVLPGYFFHTNWAL